MSSRNANENIKFISLFSGIGGFDLAFERAGMECVSVCEIDKNAQSILRRHFPKAELFDDVRKVGIATHERRSIDVICGGFPCQDVSVAGKRAGLAGERSGLWFEFARIVDELEPQWVVIENVPSLLSSNKGRDFAVIVRWLAQRGYGVAWRVLDAQYFGVPQRRRRVFIVASLGDGRAAEVLFERESGAGHPPTGREAGKEVAFSLRANPSHSGDKGDRGINTTLVANTVQAQEAKKSNSPENNYVLAFNADRDGSSVLNNISPTLTHNGDGKKAHNAYKKIAVFQQNTRDEVRLMGGKGQYVGALSAQADMKQQNYIWEMSHASEAVRESGEVAPTLQARMGTGGNQVPMVGVRRLTPTECERLQGFPDGWTDGQSDSARYRQLGNAVAVPVVEWIARRIVKSQIQPK